MLGSISHQWTTKVFFFLFSTPLGMLEHRKLQTEQRIAERLLGFAVIGFNMTTEGPRVTQKEAELAQDQGL